MRDEHVFLVAFTVETEDKSRAEAERMLHEQLIPTLQSRNPNSPVIEWWVAEDDRQDGSDNDSAVFVPLGTQGIVAPEAFSLGRAVQWQARREQR